MSQTLKLDGFRIAVTSDRRSAELIESLERRGAQTAHVPLLQMAPLQDDKALLAQTRRIIEARPGVLVVTTAYGIRRWFDTAEASGLGDQLAAAVSRCRIYARGAKSLGAVRALGFTVAGTATSGMTAELLRLVDGQLDGEVVAVQLHADNDQGLTRSLDALGAARVVPIEPYRWLENLADTQIATLVDDICAGHFDAVSFTSAPAVHALLAAAQVRGKLHSLVRSFNDRVAAATVGPVTAEPLARAGITNPLVPERFRLGAMVLQLTNHLGQQAAPSMDTVHGPCLLRGRFLTLNGTTSELSTVQTQIMRLLLEANGAVISRAELAAVGNINSSQHALDMALSRLRKALPVTELIATVIKRGYRIIPA